MEQTKGKIMTVRGLIAPEALGTTISHEHLVFDLSCYLNPSTDPEEAKLFDKPVAIDNLHFVNNNPYGNRDNCVVRDPAIPIEELKLFTKKGGNSIIDVTLDDFGRDAAAMLEISEKADVNIVAGCGHYIKSAHPAYVHEMTVEQLAQEIIDEFRNGIQGTTARPGIIGELGTGFVLDPDEIKMLRAGALAQQEIGLAINIHLHPPVRHAHQVLDILEEAGADLSRVVLSHLDGCLVHQDITLHEAVDYVASLADRGAYTEFDLCGNSGFFVTPEVSWWLPSDRERAVAISTLCHRGYGKHILLSHDVGHRHYLSSYGGWAYSHVLTGFKRTLLREGVSEYDYRQFMVENPARMLMISK